MGIDIMGIRPCTELELLRRPAEKEHRRTGVSD